MGQLRGDAVTDYQQVVVEFKQVCDSASSGEVLAAVAKFSARAKVCASSCQQMVEAGAHTALVDVLDKCTQDDSQLSLAVVGGIGSLVLGEPNVRSIIRSSRCPLSIARTLHAAREVDLVEACAAVLQELALGDGSAVTSCISPTAAAVEAIAGSQLPGYEPYASRSKELICDLHVGKVFSGLFKRCELWLGDRHKVM